MQNPCPQPSAKVIANNEDLLTQILLCLPARSLLRFKCVSKYWHSLNANSKFCDRHTLQNPNPNISALFFFKWSSGDFCCQSLPNNESPSGCPSEPLISIKHPAGIEILQSCNGLLLCGSCLKINKPWIPYVLNPTPMTRGADEEDEVDIPWIHYVLNPTTSHFLTLPATIKSREEDIWSVALAFDPSKSLYYKVLCVSMTDSSFEVEIYSSETRSWRLGKSTFDDPDTVFHFEDNYHYEVYCNGAIHWINYLGTLVHYHINEERFGVVHSSPDFEKNWEEMYYFRESGGHLHRVETYKTDNTQLAVLEMGRDYSGWSVKYHIDLRPIISVFPEMVRYDVLFVTREENEEDSSIVLHIPCKLISYNLRDKIFEKLCDLSPKGSETNKRDLQQVRGWVAHRYMETLACV